MVRPGLERREVFEVVPQREQYLRANRGDVYLCQHEPQVFDGARTARTRQWR